MSRALLHRPLLSWLVGITAALASVYVVLMAITLSYAAVEIAVTESIRNDEAAVATLESQYLAQVGNITATLPSALGYAKPMAQIFVTAPATALSMR